AARGWGWARGGGWGGLAPAPPAQQGGVVSPGLTVATWNIFGGRVWDGSRVDIDLIVATLRRLDADLVAVQEVDRQQARSHGADQARLLGEALGMKWRYAPAMLGTPGS